jgi:tetratricopeptide (TPR) repeat protein
VFLGQILDQAGSHLSEITEAYKAWVDREPRNAKANFLLAKALLASASSEEAAEGLLRRSISIDNRKWESHYELGVLLAKKRDYEGALAELVRCTNLDPKQPTPHYQLARLYARVGQPEKAKAEREIHQQLTTNTSSDPP